MIKYCFFVVIFFFNIARSFADTADEFNRYVDRMIPLSFELAKTSAGLREHELFVNLLSQSQSELGLMSENVLKISNSMNRVTALSDQSCVSVDESVLTGLFDLNYVTESLIQMRERMKVYQSIRWGLDIACEGNFSHLKIGENESRILVPKMDELDGVYVSAGSDAMKALYDLFASIFAFFSNNSEANRIQEAANRYESNRAHDEFLQQEAKKACSVERELFKPSFFELDRFFSEIDNQLKTLESIKIDRVLGKLLDCVRTLEKDTIDIWLKQISENIKTNHQKDSATQESVSRLKMRTKITSALIEIQNKSCKEINLDQVDAILAGSVILGIDQEYSTRNLKSNLSRCQRGAK